MLYLPRLFFSLLPPSWFQVAFPIIEMAQNHEDAAAELHGTLNQRIAGEQKDLAGGPIAPAPARAAEKQEMINQSDDAEHTPTPDGEEPSEHEKRTLRRIGENLPASAYLIAIVELTERFTYYGSQGLFQNYISYSATGADGPKGLGMGHKAATGLNLFFQWFCYGRFHCLRILLVLLV